MHMHLQMGTCGCEPVRTLQWLTKKVLHLKNVQVCMYVYVCVLYMYVHVASVPPAHTSKTCVYDVCMYVCMYM